MNLSKIISPRYNGSLQLQKLLIHLLLLYDMYHRNWGLQNSYQINFRVNKKFSKLAELPKEIFCCKKFRCCWSFAEFYSKFNWFGEHTWEKNWNFNQIKNDFVMKLGKKSEMIASWFRSSINTSVFLLLKMFLWTNKIIIS